MIKAIDPKVSVCVVTYNQAGVIGRCLQSLVDQAVNFDFEVLVADDFSTDGTSEIVRSFSCNFPHIVSATFHARNIGPFANFLYIHSQAKGIYVAHMDGDDYALPGKLKAQVEYLDAHHECSMVFHHCALLFPDGSMRELADSGCVKTPCDFAEFLYKYPSKSWHSAKMYRRSANMLVDRGSRKFLDKHIHFEHGRSGKVGFLNSTFSVYRVGVGISSNIYSTQELALDSYEYAIQLGYDLSIMRKIIAREIFEQGLRCLQLNDLVGFKSGVERGYRDGYRTLNSMLAFFLSTQPRLYSRICLLIRDLRARIRV